MRVPVRIKYNNSVSHLQVEAQPPSMSAEKEQEIWRVGSIEHFQEDSPVVSFSGTIKSEVLIPYTGEVKEH